MDGGAAVQGRRMFGLGPLRRCSAPGRRCVIGAEASSRLGWPWVCLSGAWAWARTRGWDDDQLHRPVPNTPCGKNMHHYPTINAGPRVSVCVCACASGTCQETWVVGGASLAFGLISSRNKNACAFRAVRLSLPRHAGPVVHQHLARVCLARLAGCPHNSFSFPVAFADCTQLSVPGLV